MPRQALKVAQLPESLEEWANFKFSDKLVARLRERKGTFEISLESVGRPERILHYIDYLCSGLGLRACTCNVFPYASLACSSLKLWTRMIPLASVYHLRLASLADALFLKSAAIMHEELAGSLELSVEEIRARTRRS